MGCENFIYSWIDLGGGGDEVLWTKGGGGGVWKFISYSTVVKIAVGHHTFPTELIKLLISYIRKFSMSDSKKRRNP